jgi:hypothetical protein
MVGATGIEPVTFTMSTKSDGWKGRKIKSFQSPFPATPAPKPRLRKAFQVARTSEHYSTWVVIFG